MQMRDLIDLVRAGLKPSEIKEMIELEKEVKDINIDEQDPEPEPEPEPEPIKEPEPKPEPEPESNNTSAEDLKKAQDEILKLKEQIKSIQNENKNKDISNNQDKTLDEQIVDIFNQML